MGRRAAKIALASLVLVAVVVGAAAWKVLHVEEIPEQLEALDEHTEPRGIVIAGMSGQPDLVFSKLEGKTTFLLVVGAKAWREGRQVNRALDWWEFPETTQGYMIGDAAGFGLFRSKVKEMMGHFAAEMRFPLYLDFEGSVVEAFKLPKGHYGLVVLGPELDVLLRHSGPVEEAGIEDLRRLLGATEPAPGPTAPPFEIGELSNESCTGRVCALAFLGEPVSGKQLPGKNDSEKRNEDEMRELMRRPATRLVMNIGWMDEFEKEVSAVVVGSLQDVELGEHWTHLEDSESARETFGVADDETALLVLDPDGRVAFRESGVIPWWKMRRVTHLMGVKDSDRRSHRD